MQMAQGHFQSIGTIEKEHAAAGITAITVETNIGHIKIEPGSSSNIQIVAEVHVLEDLSEQVAPANAERDLHVQQQDSRLLIANAHLKASDSNNWRVDLTVRVPALTSVTASTGIGDVDANGDYERAELRTGTGDITSSGDIAELTATTGVGSLELSGAYDQATIKSGTGSIDLTSAQLGSATLVTGIGDLSISAGKGPTGKLSCTSGTGSIRVELAATWSGEFEATTGTGSLKLPADLATSHTGRGPGARASGRRGSAAAEITLKTGIGSITWQDRP